jgi:GMP synthase (glutamine-hydrolysing)
LGGTVPKAGRGPQIKLETQIWQTDLKRSHPMLASKPRGYEAVQEHMEEIKALPECWTLLASSKDTEVEAAEIATGGWRFWGTQYHPEFTLHDLGAQLRVEGETLVEKGAYGSLEAIGMLASAFRHATPEDLTRHTAPIPPFSTPAFAHWRSATAWRRCQR